MGYTIEAICESCNFTASVIFGGGMKNHLTHCYVPAIDKETGQLVSEDYFEKDTFNGRFIFYNEPEMYQSRLGQKHFGWKDIKIMRTNNLCPNCKQFTMNFGYGILFD
jgi:hypothetical protein